MSGKLLAAGAGRLNIENPSDPLHTYTLEMTGKDNPKVLFLGTATGDDPTFIVSFYEAYHSGRCRPNHLRLFHRIHSDLRSFVLEQDIVCVGGGNTANALDVWRRQGLDVILREAFAQGTLMTGGSAGGLCWFEGGTTDSFGPRLEVLDDGLGLVEGSFCPHYDGDPQRRPLFHQAILDGRLPAGYAADDRVALRFDNAQLVGAVSAQPDGRAMKVFAHRGVIVEEPIEVTLLTG